MPFLMILSSIFGVIEKFIGPAIQNSSVMSIILDAVEHSKTGASLVQALEQKVGVLEDSKKREFTLELDALLGQLQLDSIEESKSKFTPRDFLFWGLDFALLMSVLVEPTINYFMDLFGGGHIPAVFMLNSMVIYMIGGLAGLHILAHSFDSYNQTQSDN